MNYFSSMLLSATAITKHKPNPGQSILVKNQIIKAENDKKIHQAIISNGGTITSNELVSLGIFGDYDVAYRAIKKRSDNGQLTVVDTKPLRVKLNEQARTSTDKE